MLRHVEHVVAVAIDDAATGGLVPEVAFVLLWITCLAVAFFSMGMLSWTSSLNEAGSLVNSDLKKLPANCLNHILPYSLRPPTSLHCWTCCSS